MALRGRSDGFVLYIAVVVMVPFSFGSFEDFVAVSSFSLSDPRINSSTGVVQLPYGVGLVVTVHYYSPPLG